MFKDIFKSFIPWMIFIFLAKYVSHLNVMIISLAAMIVFDFKNLKKGFILSWGTLIFLIFILLTILYLKNDLLDHYSWFISNGFLCLISFTSMLIRKPFTIQYAREYIPKISMAASYVYKD